MTTETTFDLDAMTAGYIKAAFFTADEELIPPTSGQFDDSPYIDRVSKATRAECRAICEAFYLANADDFGEYDADDFGIDLWMTRTGQGVGYWEADHCTKEQGERLTAAAHKLGECYLYRDRGGWYRFE